MTILNHDKIYYLFKEDGKYQKIVRYYHDWVIFPYFHYNSENEYCLIEFFNGDEFDHFLLEELLDKEHLEKIYNKTAYLLLNNSHEAFHWIVKDVYKYIVQEFKVPTQQIILLSESADICDVINATAKEYGLEPIYSKWINKFQYDVHRHNNDFINEGGSRTPPKLQTYTKKFINLNRRWRDHRTALVAGLWDRGILDLGYVSLAKSDDERNWKNILPTLENLFAEDDYFLNLFKNNKTELENFPELRVDSVDLTKNQPNLNSSLDYFYKNTYFSVISETNFFTKWPDHSARFMSEKTFKPIAYKHPFIIVSVPRFLEKLRYIGYKTFSPYINESYDLESNDSLRLVKIIDEIERLSKFNDSELEEFVKGVADICEHNYNVLMNRSDFIYD